MSLKNKLLHNKYMIATVAFIAMAIYLQIQPQQAANEQSIQSSSKYIIPIPEEFKGMWYLFVYAGKDDIALKAATGENILISHNSISGFGLPEIIMFNEYRVSDAGYHIWQNQLYSVSISLPSQENIFITILDRQSDKIIWRGSYITPDLWTEANRPIDNESQLIYHQIAHLEKAKAYWGI